MRQVFNEACKEAQKMEEFASDHPVLIGVFLTIVALGVLYLLWPAILAALGFCEDGVMLGESQIYWFCLPFLTCYRILCRPLAIALP